MLHGPECYTGSEFTSTGGTTSTMDVGLGVFGGFHLDHEVDVGDVDTTGGNVGSNKHAEFVLFKTLKGYLALVLGDVTVHYFDVFANFF